MSMLYPVENVKPLAEKIIEQLSPHCERIMVCGSIRRGKAYCHDIDMVCIPKTFTWSYIPDKVLIQGLGGVKNRDGDVVKQYTVPWNNMKIPVDLIQSSPIKWGIDILRWTGSKEHNVMLAKRALSMGMKFAVSEGLIEMSGPFKLVHSHTEEIIYEKLGLPFLQPHERVG